MLLFFCACVVSFTYTTLAYQETSSPWVRVTHRLDPGGGIIEDPVMTIAVSSEVECANWCRKLGRANCTAFSVGNTRIKPSAGECRIANTFTFKSTPDNNTNLFRASGSSRDGFQLADDGRLYKVYPGPVDGIATFAGARNVCNADDADLAIPYPKFRQDAIMRLLGSKSKANFFVGIMRMKSAGTGDGWRTDDGLVFNSTMKSSDINQNWAPLSPQLSSRVVYMGSSANGNQSAADGQWFDANLTYGLGQSIYLCRKDDEYLPMGSNGKQYKLHLEYLTNPKAAAACAAEGAKLADVSNATDFSAIRGFTQRADSLDGLLADYSRVGWLVAGTDAAVEGTWVFPSGITIKVTDWKRSSTSDLQYWRSNEPNGGTAGNCLNYMPNGFGDIWCNTKVYRFLCEK